MVPDELLMYRERNGCFHLLQKSKHHDVTLYVRHEGCDVRKAWKYARHESALEDFTSTEASAKHETLLYVKRYDFRT